MPLSTFQHQLRLSGPLLSSLERRSLSARSLSNLPASLSQLARRALPPVEVRELQVEKVVRVLAVDHRVADVAEDVDVEAAVVVQDVV